MVKNKYIWLAKERRGKYRNDDCNPGDELTGNKVNIMVVGESVPSSTLPPASTEPKIKGDVIYVPLQPPVTKDSTPPAYKPDREPNNP